MLSGVNTHHRPVGWLQHPAGCRFIAFPASFYTIPRQKSSDSLSCGTVFNRSSAASSNSTPALAEPASPSDPWGPFVDKRRDTWGNVPAGVSLALAGELGLQGPPSALGSPNTESRPSVSGRDSERSRDRMSERWLLRKSRRERYGDRSDEGRALAHLYPSKKNPP